MWGDGKQTRSFTFIDDCVEGVLRITKSDFKEVRRRRAEPAAQELKHTLPASADVAVAQAHQTQSCLLTACRSATAAAEPGQHRDGVDERDDGDGTGI